MLFRSSRLQELSHLHNDGWGIATHGDAGLTLVREDMPAYESAAFTERAGDLVGQTGIVHLRWATGALARCIENTHPFVRDDVAFMHNGSLPVTDELLASIDADLASSVEGTTDSEQYFMALLSARRRLGSVPAAVAEVLGIMDGREWPSLNMMWAEPDHLYVLCAYQNEFKMASLPENYYRLQYLRNADSVMAWSTEVREDGGEPIPNRSMLSVEASTGSIELHKL